MRLEKVTTFIKRHKKKLAFFTPLIPLGAWSANYFQDEIKSAIKSRSANVEIYTSTPTIELYKNIKLDARIDSLGLSDLAPGTLLLESDPTYISIKPNRSIKLDAVTGSRPIDNLPELKAIKVSSLPVKITASYVSGELKAYSNSIYIQIIHPVKVVHPHFDRSDTGRINLSGEWTIDIGGDVGKMNIKQGTDNSITGTYFLPGAKWSAGNITGFKDGATFRVHFTVPGKEKTEDLRVAGHFEIQNNNGNYVEIRGCAYHLQKSDTVYNKVGMEGVDCSRPAYYNRWKLLQTATFYATAPFDKQDQD